ncbi:MAG: calcium/sodium antiporter [Muribaculaceae bacterium]|nr:calcium/sodium antiporter [Muribaculaceae bacterium]
MLLNLFWLVLGAVLILLGANYLTDGASAVARKLGISDLIIGLTVVAIGTSTPELVVSVISAINGNAGLAVGNVVGSNIFNILVIIGVTSLIRPISISTDLMSKDIPLVILSALVLLVLGNTPLLNGSPNAVLSRSDGLILLLFFMIFMRHTFSTALATKEVPQSASVENEISDEPQKQPGVLLSIVYIIGGLAALIWGGDRFVDGASAVASALGVSEAVIGLTIVAAGTSLPELATSVVAAIKGKPGIALGNVIGSNIFNIFMVLGVASTIHPISFGGIGNFDLLTLTLASLLFWIFSRFYKDKTITRPEGAILLLLYIAYIIALLFKKG